jgi:hypothetical protein
MPGMIRQGFKAGEVEAEGQTYSASTTPLSHGPVSSEVRDMARHDLIESRPLPQELASQTAKEPPQPEITTH